MKLLGILWNSMGEHWKEATIDIQKEANIVKIYSIDFSNDFIPLIKKLYPFSENELWKAEYKVYGLLNQYNDNVIHVVIMDIPHTEKVFLPQKNKYMYSNVLKLKVDIRHKYKYLLKENIFGKVNGVSYDNVFHMTDDEAEYNENLVAILPFLAKHKPYKEALILDDFINETDIKNEKMGTRNAYWITPDIMFKEKTNGTYESYSELFNMYLMQELGLNNSAKYILARHHDKDGIVTKKLNNKNEKMFLGSEILNQYGIFDKKTLIYYNSQDMFPALIRKFCYDNGFIYDENIEHEFEKLYMYDLLTMQADRNPTNWAIVVDDLNRIRLVYFDHSNMMFFDNADAVNSFSEGKLDIPNYINNNITTFIIGNSSDIELCYSPKILHINKFIERSSDKQKEEFYSMFEKINLETIGKVINQIEINNNVELPINFKKALYEGFKFNIWQINQSIKEIEKGKVKKLCKKKLIFISGTIGSGKTTLGEKLVYSLPNSVLLDGDWCFRQGKTWYFDNETKLMAINNIIHTLNSYIKNQHFENIIFCWTLHKQEMTDIIVNNLILNDEVDLFQFSLICSTQTLKDRIIKRFLDREKKLQIPFTNNDVEKEIEGALQKNNYYISNDSIKLDGNKDLDYLYNQVVDIVSNKKKNINI